MGIKKSVVIISAVLMIGGAVAFSQARRYVDKPRAGEILGVDSLMDSPDRYEGPIRVEGAVTAVDSSRNLAVLIDRREWHRCGKDTCALYKLPVRWKGKLPGIHDEVIVDGKVDLVEGKLLFVASRAETLPPRPKPAAGEEKAQ